MSDCPHLTDDGFCLRHGGCRICPCCQWPINQEPHNCGTRRLAEVTERFDRPPTSTEEDA